MASSNDDIIEKLATLARLHTDGALSDEEFQALKTRLISQASKDVESEISKTVRETYGDDTQPRATAENTAFAAEPSDASDSTAHADSSPGHGTTSGEPWWLLRAALYAVLIGIAAYAVFTFLLWQQQQNRLQHNLTCAISGCPEGFDRGTLVPGLNCRQYVLPSWQRNQYTLPPCPGISE